MKRRRFFKALLALGAMVGIPACRRRVNQPREFVMNAIVVVKGTSEVVDNTPRRYRYDGEYFEEIAIKDNDGKRLQVNPDWVDAEYGFGEPDFTEINVGPAPMRYEFKDGRFKRVE